MKSPVLLVGGLVIGTCIGWMASSLTTGDGKAMLSALGGGTSVAIGLLAAEFSAARRRREARADRLVFENLTTRHKAYADLNKALLTLEKYHTRFLPRESEFDDRDDPKNFAPLSIVEEFEKSVSEVSLWLDEPTLKATSNIIYTAGSGAPIALDLAMEFMDAKKEGRPTHNMFNDRVGSQAKSVLKAVEDAHSLAGGLPGDGSSKQCVGNALAGLKSVGIVTNEVIGVWRLVDKLPATVRHNEQASLEMEIEAPTPVVARVVTSGVQIPLGAEIGEGEETISVLFNPNDQRLAKLEGRSRWECRISRSINSDISLFSRQPVTGLIIRCTNAAAMENVLKASLTPLDVELGGVPDSGWFYTSPDAVRHWYVNFQELLGQFSTAR
ncbi:MAG: hypothetical protein EOP84_25775 [Verrucomicrobiaceae bacterium]|nr:MAG: hypothetical protein EOP84_25775 [Verrucomicrobiaceae bacterium]